MAQPAASASSDSPEVPPDQPVLDESAEANEAVAAVYVGLWISAARCILTYVVAPALGAIGVVIGPFGLILQIFGGVMATIGARRLWRLKHRMWIPYAFVALAVDALAIWALVELINNWRN